MKFKENELEILLNLVNVKRTSLEDKGLTDLNYYKEIVEIIDVLETKMIFVQSLKTTK